MRVKRNFQIIDESQLYLTILNKFFKGQLEAVEVFRSDKDTKVFTIQEGLQKYVVKVIVKKRKSLFHRLLARIKRDPFFNLVNITYKMREFGCDIACHHYAVARGGERNEYAVIVMEHITGVNLRSPEVEITAHRDEIIKSVTTLHKLKAISSDISRENLLITSEGIRFIDISGRKATRFRKNNDWYDLEHRLGIKRARADISYKLFMTQKKLKSWTKAVKNSFRVTKLAS
ncbi:lipopolysaccharide core heptose(II) kinase RfaY [Pantoea sp.]|uniref:lipopolysaccharide core heptose(II) kinase RfaY n=1 Tax=Pantoea sp. TaxID=69393 RepID=UPI0028A01C97|nr:lipopolysaccharide core heptose(II) kinase RfaY [Pantoea sp.]